MANPSPRILVVVGDGAFQMTGMELSTIARHGLNPIVVVLNNHGYTTERFLLEGPFNDIHDWAYHRIPEVLGAGLGLEIRTVGELEAGLQAALANTRGLQPAERPSRPVRPQPRARAAGQPAVEDRGFQERTEPGRTHWGSGRDLGFRPQCLGPAIRPYPGGCPGWCSAVPVALGGHDPGGDSPWAVCVHW